jgi:DNA-binding response OmpR family regulator
MINIFKTYNVLIVDDFLDNLDLIDNYLNQLNGVKIYKYTDPLESEKVLKTINFSLIILDIQMPNIDGFELATKIKYGYYNKNKETPIIFITGVYNNNFYKIKGYNIGSVDYILKPIDYDVFIKKVRNYLYKSIKYVNNKRIENIKKSINI